MLKSIERSIEDTRKSGGKLDMYRTAERIRRENLSDNVAYEDLVRSLVLSIGGRCQVEFLQQSLDAVDSSSERNIPLKPLPALDGHET